MTSLFLQHLLVVVLLLQALAIDPKNAKALYKMGKVTF